MHSQRFSFSGAFAQHPSHVRQIAAFAFSISIICFALVWSAPVVRADDKTRSRAERALREGDFEMAEKLFRELLSKDAGDKLARLGLSYSLLKLGNLQDAYD